MFITRELSITVSEKKRNRNIELDKVVNYKKNDLIVEHQTIKQASVAFDESDITMIHFIQGLMKTIRLYLLQR